MPLKHFSLFYNKSIYFFHRASDFFFVKNIIYFEDFISCLKIHIIKNKLLKENKVYYHKVFFINQQKHYKERKNYVIQRNLKIYYIM